MGQGGGGGSAAATRAASSGPRATTGASSGFGATTGTEVAALGGEGDGAFVQPSTSPSVESPTSLKDLTLSILRWHTTTGAYGGKPHRGLRGRLSDAMFGWCATREHTISVGMSHRPARQRSPHVMSHSVRPKLAAALLGAATLSAVTSARADDRGHQTAPERLCQSIVAESCASRTTLGDIIEARLEAAQAEHRYNAIDELATLWLSLSKRGQLDRVVERGEQFLNVSLRNQRISELRRVNRALKRLGGDDAALAELPVDPVPVAQGLDAERFVQSLEEPYRTAVQWSLIGLNHREVAEKMGASHAAVRKWAQRLRERIEPSDIA